MAIQATACANKEHRYCPSGNLYMRKKLSANVVIATAPEKGTILVLLPNIVKKPKGPRALKNSIQPMANTSTRH